MVGTAVAMAVIVASVLLIPVTNAATIKATYQGVYGSNGTITVRQFTDGTGSAIINMHALTRGRTYTFSLNSGTCAVTTTRLIPAKTITVSPSLDGTWRGTWDSCANFFDLTLELNQSATGGIGGIMYIATQAYPLNGASLAGSQVSISLLNGLILQGTLSADERSMSGQWSFQGNTGCTWSVSLRD